MIRWVVDFINTRIADVAFIYHLIPCIMRHIKGGLYVFRDCPTWVLEEICVDREERAPYEPFNKFLDDAVSELSMRNRRDLL